MKITELGIKEQINEGFGDFINRTGLMGQDNKSAANSKQQDERAKSIGLKDFTYKLNSALQSAIKGGVVAVPTASAPAAGVPAAGVPAAGVPAAGVPAAGGTQPGAAAMNNMVSQLGATPGGNTMANAPVSKTNVAKKPEPSMAELLKQRQQKGLTESQYKIFNKLVENKILNEESESISKFITDFIKTQTENLKDNPNYQKNIDDLAKQLEASYLQNKKLDASLISKAWDTIWAWSQLGKKQGGYGQQSQKFDDQRDQWLKFITMTLSKIDPNNPDSVTKFEEIAKSLHDFATQQKK